MLAQWLMRKHTWLTLTEARLNLIHPPSRMSTLAIGIYDTASLGRGLGSRAIRLLSAP